MASLRFHSPEFTHDTPLPHPARSGAGVSLLPATSFLRCLSVPCASSHFPPTTTFSSPPLLQRRKRVEGFTREDLQLVAEELRFSPTDPQGQRSLP